jgi:hypothetical protein
MANAYFAALAGPSGSRFSAAPDTAGPWDPRMQHGGPPGALLVLLAEHVAATQTGRSDLTALRFAGEFVGPVPVGEVEVTTLVVRAARSGVLVALSLSSGGRSCLDARVWLVRDADTSIVAHPRSDTSVPTTTGRGLGWSFPWADTIEWRAESGSLVEAGPARMWARPRLRVLAGVPLTGLQHAVLVGDSASGVSSELDWAQWSFLNVDLDVHLARPVQGEWICIDAATQLGAHGSGLARSTLFDVYGPVGATAQTLVVAPRALSTRSVG